MAKILTGKEVAASINEESKKVIERLAREGIVPCIGIIRIGENESDISYEKGLLKRCEAMRLNVKKYMLPSDVSEERVIRTIEEANEEAETGVRERGVPYEPYDFYDDHEDFANYGEGAHGATDFDPDDLPF